MDQPITINKYLFITLLYFFLNGFLLPHGLLYTSILTPFFILWLYGSRQFEYQWYFLLIIPYVIIHFLLGVNVYFYMRSLVLLFSVFIFGLALDCFLDRCGTLRTLYKNVLLINIVLVGIAVLGLLIPDLATRLWYKNEITFGFSTRRLQLLTYEPSYYSTLLAPIALYYYLKMLILKLPNPKTVLIFITVPLLLSLSFGVILGVIISLALTLLLHFKRIFPKSHLFLYLVVGGMIFLVLLFAFIELFPGNVFVVRLTNVLAGRDTSFRGRTTDSFILAWQIASKKSIWFGCGLGQAKELGLDIFRNFYNYANLTVEDIGIPNAVGDTMANFGITGVIIRMAVEIWFFFKCKVYSNYYRLSLFTFIFIYQFTGSFIMNIAEYAIWILAFKSNIFPEFNRKEKVSVVSTKN
jgi:hypothetical protein